MTGSGNQYDHEKEVSRESREEVQFIETYFHGFAIDAGAFGIGYSENT